MIPPKELAPVVVGTSTTLVPLPEPPKRVLLIGDKPRPTNSVEAISASAGTFDTVVIMAGYDEWWTSFPSSFDAVVAASRAKGATRILWLTYREGVGLHGAARSNGQRSVREEKPDPA